jgi:hypothetical protein
MENMLQMATRHGVASLQEGKYARANDRFGLAVRIVNELGKGEVIEPSPFRSCARSSTR